MKVDSSNVREIVLKEADAIASALGHTLMHPWVDQGRLLLSRCASCWEAAKVAPRSFTLPRFAGPALYLYCVKRRSGR